MTLENYFEDYNIDDPNSYDHWFSHRLGVVIRFFDVFTGRTIDHPLNVTVPSQGWNAVHRRTDSTYRFLFTNEMVPAGNFTIEIESITQEYAHHLPLLVTLPVVPSTPPVRSDYIVTHPLWPTRNFAIPAGESAVVGRIVSGSASATDNMQIRLFEHGTSSAAAPIAFSDDNGEFSYRLPWHRQQVAGTVISPPPAIDIQINGPGGLITPIIPPSINPQPGLVHTQTFLIS
jgi:hypothetical protein